MAPHGTKARYDHWKCRCGLCRAANAAMMREYRETGKMSGKYVAPLVA